MVRVRIDCKECKREMIEKNLGDGLHFVICYECCKRKSLDEIIYV